MRGGGCGVRHGEVPVRRVHARSGTPALSQKTGRLTVTLRPSACRGRCRTPRVPDRAHISHCTGRGVSHSSPAGSRSTEAGSSLPRWTVLICRPRRGRGTSRFAASAPDTGPHRDT
ncbi:hypothetical protein SHJG_0776 [Streptomyces hygroscopicus subsp. jinggangensis 5008]|nr:hypothetical protein SHJG_0776 [Streptomyces hygroscopicus subsp. jinggangensis 5008]AGF60275.1 hypothetical protein SHJGH_0609 [Streptomyces hygroscopicus subsp. jinggangensis TL01]